MSVCLQGCDGDLIRATPGTNPMEFTVDSSLAAGFADQISQLTGLCSAYAAVNTFIRGNPTTKPTIPPHLGVDSYIIYMSMEFICLWSGQPPIKLFPLRNAGCHPSIVNSCIIPLSALLLLFCVV